MSTSTNKRIDTYKISTIEKSEVLSAVDDETKEILIDLVDYYCRMGTKLDPGIGVFESVVQRASKALERHAAVAPKSEEGKRSGDVDPFAITAEFPAYKLEDEW